MLSLHFQKHGVSFTCFLCVFFSSQRLCTFLVSCVPGHFFTFVAVVMGSFLSLYPLPNYCCPVYFALCHLAWLIYSCLSNDCLGFSQYRLYHLRLGGQTARIPPQPCHSLAVWAWTSRLASVCLSFLLCKMWYHSPSQGGRGWGPSELHRKRLRQWLTQVYVVFDRIPWNTWL